MRHIILISGKDSACTAIVQKSLQPDLDYEYIFNPTGAEIPPIYEWLDSVSIYLGKPIRHIGKDLREEIENQGILPSIKVRFCTRLCKISPLEDFLDNGDTFVYYGLRYDEPYRSGYNNNKNKNITPRYPLRDLRLGLPEVWTIMKQKDLLPPFLKWDAVIDGVKNIMGSDFSVVDTLTEWHYRSLFSWRVREFNCAYCFFMRQYEYIGLLCHYPDIYWNAAEIEKNTGASDYTIREGYSLYDLAERKDQVINKRVNQVCKTLYKLAQKNIFTIDLSDDLLSVTSCGLFCGK